MAQGIKGSTPDCSIEGCGRLGTRRHMCEKHYRRVMRTGSPEKTWITDPVKRFWSYVDVGHPLGCWLWTAGVDPDGYGQFKADGVSNRAHRYAYELLIGPIPDGLQIDHLCRVRACVNPDHLEPVTAAENTLRGFGPSALNARKTECVQGHPFDEGNTLVRPDGARVCRECNREWFRRWYRESVA